MKTLTAQITFMAMLFAIPIIASAQVYDGDLTLSTQAQVDAFHYTEVTGTLTIGYGSGTTFSDINSLQPLSKLTKVGSSLIIRHNNQLQDLQGLENLTIVEGSLDIINNASLTSLQGLENLTTTGQLTIEGNMRLTTLQNLENLASVSGFSIIDNAQLQDLQGLNNLTNPNWGYISGNAGLTSLKGLENLSSLDELAIFDNDQLQNLQGLENLTALTGESGFFSIGGNDGLTSLQGLENLTVVENSLAITNNASLTSLQGLENLTTIVGVHGLGLYITDNASLTSLQGLENLSTIGGASHITNNASLTSLQGLDNITSAYSLRISENAQLQNLLGLKNLATIDGSLFIENNPGLSSLQGLENIQSLGSLFIEENPNLNDCCAIADVLTKATGTKTIRDNGSNCNSVEIIQDNCPSTIFYGDLTLRTQAEVDAFHYTEVTGSLTIGFEFGTTSSDITNLQPVSKLTKVGASLVIRNNNQLQDLQGLENLVTSQVRVERNSKLSSLKGLKNSTLLDELIIVNNDQLQNLQGLEDLISLTRIWIYDNGQLQNLQGLKNLDFVNELGIRNNGRLTSLQGLENLTTIGSTLTISSNPQLESLQGLENLHTIQAILNIIDNDRLTSLQGLENVTWGFASLFIAYNDQLTSLQGLENIQPYIHGGLSIFENPQLNDCCAIARLASGAIRLKTIRDNGSNCSSVEVIQENCPQTITHFTLIDAASNKSIFELYKYENPVVINVLEVGNQLNIRANTSPQVVGSVVFELDGEVIRTENVFPYALAGDDPPGEYFSWTPPVGRHTLTATPYTEKRGKGMRGSPLTIDFIVSDQPLAVISFTLIATADNSDLFELKEGDKISLEKYNYTGLNIRANISPATVGSVVFELDGKKFNTENVYPYALAGDKPPGKYHSWIPPLGRHTLTATPYPERRGRGTAGTPLTITFEVIENDEDQMAAVRTMPATSQKTKPTDDATEELHAEHIWVYPNPSEGMLSIRLPATAQDVKLYLYNSLGHKVMETTGGNEGSLVIDVSHLASGLYVLKVASGQSTAMHRILLK